MNLPVTSRIKNTAVAREIRQIKKFLRNINQDLVNHNSTHYKNGLDPIRPGDIGAETPTGAQNKADTAESNANSYTDSAADTAESNANSYTDSHEEKNNPHPESQNRNGGTTANRPSSPNNYQFYFDTDLNKPIWWNGNDWVDSTGTIV